MTANAATGAVEPAADARPAAETKAKQKNPKNIRIFRVIH
jgi:hypothetical protein